jgi:pimeloyl-ACP methyl ester carboxylesterase
MNDQVQSNHVRCNGLQVHYEDHGAGAPVVLLHGGLVTGHLMWSSHVPALSRNHRVVVPDSRGHSRTDNPEGRLAYDLMADDRAAFIEALRLDRPVVVGYSDGAQTALELGVHRAGGGGRRQVRARVPLFRDVVLDFLARHSEATRPSTGARFQTQGQEQGDRS